MLPGAASAVPTVKFKAKSVPIAGFPHTGNIRGAGAAFESEFVISGTEYGGFPPPLIGVNVFFPKGTRLTPAGFPAQSDYGNSFLKLNGTTLQVISAPGRCGVQAMRAIRSPCSSPSS